MGRPEALDFEGAPHRAGATRPRGRTGWGVAGAIAVLLLGLLLLRKPLADLLWPAARVQELSQQARAALERGHLTAADGTGARELYQAAIAIDPDRVEPRAGLARVAHAALAKAEAALRGEDFEQAHRWLALARELEVPRARADAFAARLRAREADVAGIPQLLARADAAASPQDALPVYARVLSLRPQNIRALEGREDALSVLLQQAQSAVGQGDLIGAARLVATAQRFDAGHVDLPQVRSELARAVDALRQRAERAQRRGDLAAAEAGLRQLLALDGEDAAAQRGLAALAEAHALRAGRAASNFDFTAAGQSLERARTLDPDAPGIAQAERKIAASRATRSRLGAASAPARPGPRARARVAALLREAAAAEARGDLLTPPGESAYDKVRAAAALAPQSPGVRNAQRRLAPAARACFERELPRNDLGRARACLESWVALQGEGTATRRARTRLAQRWLAVGDERMVAGQIAGAQAALQAAHALDRSAPGIEEFRRRLRVATASGE
jgi:tetratricopeptide (TPR) repeat protein